MRLLLAALFTSTAALLCSSQRALAQATGAVSVLHTFSPNGTEGTLPIMGPIKASDGNYYGVTDQGGDARAAARGRHGL